MKFTVDIIPESCENHKDFSDLKSAIDYVHSAMGEQGLPVLDEVEFDDHYTSLQEVYDTEDDEFEWMNVDTIIDGELHYAAIISNNEMIHECGDDEDDDDEEDE